MTEGRARKRKNFPERKNSDHVVRRFRYLVSVAHIWPLSLKLAVFASQWSRGLPLRLPYYSKLTVPFSAGSQALAQEELEK